MQAWEELHWRFLEEVKEIIRDIKKIAKRESLTLQEIRFYALLPNAQGQAWLKLPGTFDLMNPDGWFKTELEPRIERRQERTLWRLTWDGGRRERQGPGQPAGGEGPAAGGERDRQKLLGPKLTAEEVNRARERAPLDKNGVLLCWSNLTHQGCAGPSCQRSHEALRGPFEQLDPCVRTQLIRRGGLKRMKAETDKTAETKIRELRQAIAADRASKTAKPKRKAGENGASPEGETSEVKAGGSTVRFWDVPEEFEAVDYTAQEDLKDILIKPDQNWGVPVPHQDRPPEGGDERAPDHARRLVEEARKLHEGPVLSALETATDDLYAWASARLARNPEVSLRSLLEEMQMYGASDLATEAASFLEGMEPDGKAGETARLVVKDTEWAQGEPGQGAFELDGLTWHTWDYMENIPLDEEAASMLGLPEPVEEKRQRVTKALCAGVLWRNLARRPTLAEVEAEAVTVRKIQTRAAIEALDQMGAAADFVTPIEHELRAYAHDVTHPHHERDFRSFAIFQAPTLAEARAVVLRADIRGRLLVESLVGDAWMEGGWTLFAFIWKGHMVFAQPPETLNVESWLAGEEVTDTPVLGFSFYWHARHDQPVSAPGKAMCRHCKPGRKAGENMINLRLHSQLASVAVVAGAAPSGTPRILRGSDGQLVLRELFAGKATLMTEWLRQGGQALQAVEVYEHCHHRTGYRPEHDLSRPEVQQLHLHNARQGRENIGWIASPCTSFCDWNIENGGSRTFANPEGGVERPLTKTESQGNTLSEFGAQYFETMLDSGGFPIAESSGCSGRYPKQWDLPCWRRILKRPDVNYVEFRMCAFGLGPPDEPTHFYQHLTRIVFPRCSELKAALSRQCPGVSPSHQHVALKGSRPGSTVTRCTEAGVYCEQFVRTIVTLRGWGVPVLTRPLPFRQPRQGEERERVGEMLMSRKLGTLMNQPRMRMRKGGVILPSLLMTPDRAGGGHLRGEDALSRWSTMMVSLSQMRCSDNASRNPCRGSWLSWPLTRWRVRLLMVEATSMMMRTRQRRRTL